MPDEINGAKDLLEFQINRNIVNLYKAFLVLTEDICYENQTNFAKLKRAIPADAHLIDQANCLDDAKMEYLRKRILDAGNDCVRQILTDCENYSINLNL